jgi:hypothetical protein
MLKVWPKIVKKFKNFPLPLKKYRNFASCGVKCQKILPPAVEKQTLEPPIKFVAQAPSVPIIWAWVQGVQNVPRSAWVKTDVASKTANATLIFTHAL